MSETPESGGPSKTQIVLSGQQKALYEELASRDPSLAEMYLGAITLFHNKDIPDYLAFAAHGIRELIEKLPLYLGLVKPHKGLSLTERCRNFSFEFKRAKQRSISFTGSKFEGEIDPDLDRMLLKMAKFIEDFEEDYPARKEHMARVVRKLDPLPVSLPTAIERSIVEQFLEYKNYFQGAAHHMGTDDESFLAHLYRLERFLLDYLRPQTFTDQSELDALIRYGEADAE